MSQVQITDPSKPMIWYEGQNRKWFRAPQEGDTVIKEDGTRVVLKNGLAGVLGAGQGVDPFTGYTDPTGVIMVAVGKNAPAEYPARGALIKDPKTGEAHFYEEWMNMMKASTKPRHIKDGERMDLSHLPIGYREMENNANGMWEWNGESWEDIFSSVLMK